MYKFQDDYGMPVTLTFNESIYKLRLAQHVLVFAFYEGNLLFTVNTERGIELPGGKVEPDETSLAAAVRETYEETGYSLSYIEKIGQYTVGESIVKDIFVACAEQNRKEMRGGTVGGSILFEGIPPHMKGDPRFSRFLYDDVYPLTIEYLKENGFLSRKK